MSGLADIIRQARAERAWPQEQLAEIAGVSLRTVQRVEQGAPCAPETLKALAAALDLDTRQLMSAAPVETKERVLGLSAGAAFWVGLALCVPTLQFLVTNIAFYGFDLGWIEPALPERLYGPWIDNIIVMLGLPLIAFGLNAAHLLGVRWRQGAPGSVVIESVVLRWRPAQFAVATMAGGLFTVVTIIVLRERLYQVIGA
jgi:transcriptional regulator with XRE-family HTH domain